MANSTKQGGAANRALVVIGLFIFVALVGVIVVLVMLLNRGGEEEPEETQRSTLITQENVEEVIEEAVRQPPVEAPSSYEVSMTMDWIFPDGASPSGNAYVENVTSNETDIYFDVLLRETQEILYQSPVIPLGGRLTDITLQQALPAGVYPCIVEYHLIDANQNTLGTVNMGITITVEN